MSSQTASLHRLTQSLLLSPTTTQSPRPKSSSSAHVYLPHLDGIRALALLGVLLFHFEVPGSTGGFAGVDIFLVLSGYLITRNILREVYAQTFSFSAFYTRRLHRLYPASVVTVFIALIFALLLAQQEQAYATANSSVASLFVFSNIHFWAQSGYFDKSALSKPLLHFWSLSLEEQFYLFWPLLLVKTASRSPVAVKRVTAFVSVISLLLNIALHREHPSFVFFMLPTRVYEFGIGALCAQFEPMLESFCKLCRSRSHYVVEAVSLASFVTVFLSFFMMPTANSAVHMFPVLIATCFLILLRHTFIASTVLSNRMFTALGKLSYSAYLLHWVIFVYMRNVSKGIYRTSPNPITLFILTIVSAYILKRYIEDPLRKPKTSRQRFFPLAITLLTCALALSGSISHGWKYRMSRSRFQSDLENFDAHPMSTFRPYCLDPAETPKVATRFADHSAVGCLLGEYNGSESSNVVMGDSFARHIMPAFHAMGQKRHVSFRFYYLADCPFVSKNDDLMISKSRECKNMHQLRWGLLESSGATSLLKSNSTIIVANWGRSHSMPLEDRRKNMLALNNDLRKSGHFLRYAGQPPGIGGTERWRIECLDLATSPMFRLLRFALGLSSQSCISELIAPTKRLIRAERDLHKIFDGIVLKREQYISVYDALCGTAPKPSKVMCRASCLREKRYNQTFNYGYQRDGGHLNRKGSECLWFVYDNALYL